MTARPSERRSADPRRKTWKQSIYPRLALQPSGCVEWTGPTSPTGYAMVSRMIGSVVFREMVHRIIWRLWVGEIPEGMTLDHLCRNRICVNPDHLEPVTRGENTLRGDTITAHNKAKTHCLRGHELAGANLDSNSLRRGHRDCRQCRNARRRKS